MVVTEGNFWKTVTIGGKVQPVTLSPGRSNKEYVSTPYIEQAKYTSQRRNNRRLGGKMRPESQRSYMVKERLPPKAVHGF